MTVLFADLDRTLIYSANALDPTAPQTPAPRLRCVEMRRGRPASFVTETAAAGIGRLLDSQLLIPVTTRSVKQYRRVRLPGPVPRLALVANGGRLLRDGVVDASYSAAVAASCDGSARLDDVLGHLNSVVDSAFCRGGRTVPQLRAAVTNSAGALAGEEIVAWAEGSLLASRP